MKQELKDKYLTLFSTYNIPLARTNKQILERFSSDTAPESDPDIAEVKYVPSSKTYNYRKRVKDEYYQYHKTIQQYLKSTVGWWAYGEFGLNIDNLLQLRKIKKLTQRDINFLCGLLDILTFGTSRIRAAYIFALKNQAEFVRFLEEREKKKKK